MRRNKKLVLFSVFTLFLLSTTAFAGPTLSEVLSKEGAPGRNPIALAYWAVAAAFFVSVAALSFKFKGAEFLKKTVADKSIANLFGSSKEEEALRIKKELKELVFSNEELSRENVRLVEDKNSVAEEKQRLEEVVQSRVIAEELLKKSNESLRRAYDKLLSEKEALILEMSQGAFSGAVEKEQEPRKEPAPPRTAELRAVEDLINEVGENISSNKKGPKKKQAKAEVKKAKKTAAPRKKISKKRKKK